MSNNMTLKEQMKSLAHQMMHDVSDAYEDGNPVEAYNALQRLKVGAEGLEKLAQTAEILDYPEGAQ